MYKGNWKLETNLKRKLVNENVYKRKEENKGIGNEEKGMIIKKNDTKWELKKVKKDK